MIPRRPGSIGHCRVYRTTDIYPIAIDGVVYDTLDDALRTLEYSRKYELGRLQIDQNKYLQYLLNTYEIHRDPHFYTYIIDINKLEPRVYELCCKINDKPLIRKSNVMGPIDI